MAGTGTSHLRDRDDAVLRVEDLVVEFPAGRHETVHAVSGISLDVRRGETLGLVGESGCGKSTTGNAIVQLPPPTSGRVELDGTDLAQLAPEALRQTRTRLQIILQDPISSLNPRRKVRDIVAEGLAIWPDRGGDDPDAKVDEMLEAVGLDPEVVGDRRPHEFSGGQCQRICIARALVLGPEVIICDEPVSALDVSVQAQILNLIEDLKAEFGLTLVFITHDLAVVKTVSDRVAVMYLGKLCEVGSTEQIFSTPAHPYTRLLLSSIPELEGSDLDVGHDRTGEIPSPLDPPSGCRYRTRCPRADDQCAIEEPQMRPVEGDHHIACHHPHTDHPDALDGATATPAETGGEPCR